MDLILDSLRHNTWATVKLLKYCAELSHDELHDESTEVVPGSIYWKLQHFVVAEHSNYRRAASGAWPTRWPWERGERPGLDVMEERAKDSLAFWEELISRGADGDDVVVDRWKDGSEAKMRLGPLVAQLLNHGNHHRAEVNALITRLGKEPPDLSGLSYAEETGRGVPHNLRG